MQVRKHETYMNRSGDISPAALQYMRDIAPEMWTLCYDIEGAYYGRATKKYNGVLLTT